MLLKFLRVGRAYGDGLLGLSGNVLTRKARPSLRVNTLVCSIDLRGSLFISQMEKPITMARILIPTTARMWKS